MTKWTPVCLLWVKTSLRTKKVMHSCAGAYIHTHTHEWPANASNFFFVGNTHSEDNISKQLLKDIYLHKNQKSMHHTVVHKIGDFIQAIIWAYSLSQPKK